MIVHRWVKHIHARRRQTDAVDSVRHGTLAADGRHCAAMVPHARHPLGVGTVAVKSSHDGAGWCRGFVRRSYVAVGSDTVVGVPAAITVV